MHFCRWFRLQTEYRAARRKTYLKSDLFQRKLQSHSFSTNKIQRKRFKINTVSTERANQCDGGTPIAVVGQSI